MRFKIKNGEFTGFTGEDMSVFFKYPRVLEFWWGGLSGSEHKVLDFILRQLIGFQKDADAISLDQFTKGIGKNNRGTGLSESQVRRAVKNLELKGFIEVERRRFGPSIFRIRFAEGVIVDGQGNTTTIPQKDVRDVIERFRTIDSGNIEKILKDKRQFAAMTRVMTKYGPLEAEWLVCALQFTRGKENAPSIASPLELESKLPNLVGYIKKQAEKFPRSVVSLELGVNVVGKKHQNAKPSLEFLN